MIYPRFSCKYLAFAQYFKPNHQAVDIPRYVTINGIGTRYANQNLYMAYEGKIVKNKYASDYGWYVEYEVKDGNDTYLFASGHMDKQSSLKIGKTYPMGTFVGICGKLGKNSTGYHDHFRVIKNGKRVDPLKTCYAYTDWNVQGSKEFAKLNWYDPKAKPVDTKHYIKLKSGVWCRKGAGFKYKKYKVIPKGTKCELLAKNVKTVSGYTWDKIIYNNETVYLPNNWNTYL